MYVSACRLVFSYEILTPAALNFFVSYAEGAVESLWSIDQYFQFVLVLMLSTGLSFQVGLGLCCACTGARCCSSKGPYKLYCTMPAYKHMCKAQGRRHKGVACVEEVFWPVSSAVSACTGPPGPGHVPIELESNCSATDTFISYLHGRMPCYMCPQVPIIQVMLGQLGIVNSSQMFSLWRYVVVGSTVVAAVLTPSTDPFTQALLAIPLVGLYMGGASVVRFIEQSKANARTA